MKKKLDKLEIIIISKMVLNSASTQTDSYVRKWVQKGQKANTYKKKSKPSIVAKQNLTDKCVYPQVPR